MSDTEDTQSEITPTLSDVMRQLKLATKYETKICIPATVITYYSDKQTLDVQPNFTTNYPGTGTVEKPEPIYNVPVEFLRAGNFIFSLPLAAGDQVTLWFSDRSIENWQSTGGVINPNDVRAHHLSDAMGYPGGYPLSKSIKLANSTSAILKIWDRSSGPTGQGIELRLNPNGHIQILNQSDELVKVLVDMLQSVFDAFTETANGPQKLLNPIFPSIMKRLKTFLEGA